ncbi:MAG: helix-turn-helix domain-containing protein, partial [Pseudomonadota bacterium]
ETGRALATMLRVVFQDEKRYQSSMTRTSLKDVNCSVAQFAEILGDKWSLLIVRDAFTGVSTFSEFQKRLNVSKNVLTERLNNLVRHGIMDRVQTRPDVERYTYELTARGKALFPIGTAIMQWGDKWVFGSEGEPVRVLDKETGAPVQSIVVLSRSGNLLELDDVEYQPGPRAIS